MTYQSKIDRKCQTTNQYGRIEMRTLAICLLVLISSGCQDLSEVSNEYETYARFEESQESGRVPKGMIPVSATKIKLSINLDLNVVFLDFDYNLADHEKLTGRFRPLSITETKELLNRRLLLLEVESGTELFFNCQGNSTQLLAVANGHAHYWTTRSIEIESFLCTSRAQAK